MEQCDVLVVGGGPAGATFAWRLVGAGMDVLVMDKTPFPRDKVCAGWVTPAVLEELTIDTGEYADGRVLQPISAFRTGVIGGGEVTTEYHHPVSYGIRRCEFDHYLLARSGARLLNEAFAGMVRAGNHWIVNGHIRTPLVVGAGGHFCPVARFLGARPVSGEHVVAAQEVEFELTPAQQAAGSARPGVPELFFCRDLKGYGWVFRKGNVLNIGLGRDDRHRLGRHVGEFIAFLKERGKVPQDIPDRLHGHAYLLYRQAEPRPLLGDGVLLVGDAAGLAYPQSGEGIRPAVESALIAADVVQEAAGDYHSEELALYEERMLIRFGQRRARTASPIRLPAGVKRFVGTRLLGNRSFSRHVVLDRWFLHRNQSPLFTRTARPGTVRAVSSG